jgi:hypothetical protein
MGVYWGSMRFTQKAINTAMDKGRRLSSTPGFLLLTHYSTGSRD